MANATLPTKIDDALRKSLEDAHNKARLVIGEVRQDFKSHLTSFNDSVSDKLEKLTRKSDDILDRKDAESGDNNLKEIQEAVDDLKKLVNSNLKPQQEESSQTSSGTKGKTSTVQSHQDPEIPRKWPKLDTELEKILEDAAQEYKFSEYNRLDENHKNCLLCLGIFPQGAIIKKRTLIYWWIGEGFVNATAEETAEEVGEEYFRKLVEGNWIDPVNDKSSSIVRECTMDPWVHWLVVCLARKESFFDLDESGTPCSSLSKSRFACLMKTSEPMFRNLGEPEHTDQDGSSGRRQKVSPGEQKQSSDQEGSSRGHHKMMKQLPCLEAKVSDISSGSSRGHQKISLMSVFNVDAERLNAQDLFKKLKIMKSLHVLQLGRWQTSAEHHIEFVDEESEAESMHKLPLPKRLRYLSLSGISRITELPYSIRYLSRLKVLDLGNCQNLEKLGNGIIFLESLTHLDVSKCYLLDHMPKGLGSLSQLEVLKGFIFGSSRSNDFCQLAELTKLKKLKKLSISIGSGAHVSNRELTKLKDINGLQSLSITWGRLLRTLSTEEKTARLKNWTELSYPSSLEKLDLQCYPKEDLEIVGSLQGLKKLYLRGGKVKTLRIDIKQDPEVGLNVIRLKFLQHLYVEWPDLQKKLPHINYVEICQCPHIGNPPKLDAYNVWIREPTYSESISGTPSSSEISPGATTVSSTMSDPQTLSAAPTVIPESTTVTDAAPVATPGPETTKTTTTSDAPQPDANSKSPLATSNASDQGSGTISDSLIEATRPTPTSIIPDATPVVSQSSLATTSTTDTSFSELPTIPAPTSIIPDVAPVVTPTSLVETTTTNPLTDSDAPSLLEMPTDRTPSNDSATSSTATAISPTPISDTSVVATMTDVPSHPPPTSPGASIVSPPISSINDPTSAPDAISTKTDVAPTVSPSNIASLPPPLHE